MSTASTVLPEKTVDDFSLWQAQPTDSKTFKPEKENNVMKEMCVVLGMHMHFLVIFKTFIKEKIYNCEDRQGCFGSRPQCNTNIKFLTENKYEYIRKKKFHRIWIYS